MRNRALARRPRSTAFVTRKERVPKCVLRFTGRSPDAPGGSKNTRGGSRLRGRTGPKRRPRPLGDGRRRGQREESGGAGGGNHKTPPDIGGIVGGRGTSPHRPKGQRKCRS